MQTKTSKQAFAQHSSHQNIMKTITKHLADLGKCGPKSMNIINKGAPESSLDTSGPKVAPEA